MSEAAMVQSEEPIRHREGKYLTFELGDTEYALQILKVREIIGMMDVTTVARTPEFVRGVMNLRGKIIPVLGLRRVLAMESVEDDSETRIIVVELGDMEVGVVVDQVQEVLDVVEEHVEDAPSFGLAVNTDFVLGMAKGQGRVTILLDIDKVLSQQDIAVLESLDSE
ncbi:MAG: purine-binding chemotaxis protein CheW [bacterium]|nr:purine-binding chemotaxis protein CheW [bacterium]